MSGENVKLPFWTTEMLVAMQNFHSGPVDVSRNVKFAILDHQISVEM